jgi:hypothetical protein
MAWLLDDGITADTPTPEGSVPQDVLTNKRLATRCWVAVHRLFVQYPRYAGWNAAGTLVARLRVRTRVACGTHPV